MCVVSMVGDFYSHKWGQPNPYIQPVFTPNPPNLLPSQPSSAQLNPYITRAEFDQLKKDVADMKELLIRAKKYDEATNQPDCEMEDKIALLKKVAELVGVDLNEVFGK